MAEDKNTIRKPKGERIISLIISKIEYGKFIACPKHAKRIINQQIIEFPELFPSVISKGYTLNGTSRPSIKCSLVKRQIIIDNIHYQLHPSFILPDMRGELTKEIEDGLYLRSKGLCFEAITRVCGKNESFWYRLEQRLGKHNLVSTTIYGTETKVPANILCDEKHTKVTKSKHYIATTVGEECILGAEIVNKADTKTLTEGYAVFAQEAKVVQADYTPESVNTDG